MYACFFFRRKDNLTQSLAFIFTPPIFRKKRKTIRTIRTGVLFMYAISFCGKKVPGIF